MAFLQLKSDDSWYYEQVKDGNFKGIKEKINAPYMENIEEIIAFPSPTELKANLHDPKICFLSPDRLFDNNLLIVKELPKTKYSGIKSTQQELYFEDINSELYNKFGLVVSEPTTTFSDLGGFEIPKEEMLKTQDFIKKGLIQKNLSMFLGVSRSGKSFFAECLAGELRYKLILLDLGVIMNDKNPSKKLDNFFYYLENIDEYVLLIDEIEKVADPSGTSPMAKVLIGKLLTIFNNFNSESGFNIKNNFVIATANNILDLLNKNPEFINRFGLKYFVGYPEKQTFIDVCEYYIKRMKVSGITGEDIYNHSNSIYIKDTVPSMEDSFNVRYGKYASGEVKEFMSNLLLHCCEKNGTLHCDTDILNKVLHLQKPQIRFANKGVINTIQAAKIANFREVN